MNVFGHLLKSDRNQTFVDRSREFTSSNQSSVDKMTQKSKNLVRKKILWKVFLHFLIKSRWIHKFLRKFYFRTYFQIFIRKGDILIQNGSTTNLSNIKYPHKRKFKLDELKSIPFSLTKYLRKLKENAMKYTNDSEKFCTNDQKYINSVTNSILKAKMLEMIQNKPKRNIVSYRQN